MRVDRQPGSADPPGADSTSRQIGLKIAELTALLRQAGWPTEPIEPATPSPIILPAGATELVNRAQQILSARRARTALFPATWFGEPAWDIVLDLYVAERGRQPVSITSACIAAAVPPTTALRWIDRLIAEHWIARTASLFDRRTVHLKLLPHAHETLEAWLRRSDSALAI